MNKGYTAINDHKLKYCTKSNTVCTYPVRAPSPSRISYKLI